MYVMEGVSYERSDGSWHKIEVALDDADYQRQAAEWGFSSDAMPQSLRHQVLSLVAEVMVFQRMVIARRHDIAWSEERSAWGSDLSTRLKAIKEKVKEYDDGS